QGQDVGVLELRGDPDFPEEAVGADERRDFRAEHFEGDLAVVLQVRGEEHHRHSALADLAVEAVAVGETGPELVEDFVHNAFVTSRHRSISASVLKRAGAMRICPSLTVTSTLAPWNADRTSASGFVMSMVTMDDRLPGGVKSRCPCLERPSYSRCASPTVCSSIRATPTFWR